MTGPWKIVEGIEGHWSYHIAPIDSDGSKAICGRQTMLTHDRLEFWGYRPSHLPVSYCAECERLAREATKGVEQ